MRSLQIKSVKALEVIDSRGNPTVETEVWLSSGKMGRAIVPSGASTGIHEALELRDNDKRRFCGKGVLKALESIEKKLGPEVIGRSFSSIQDFDSALLKLDPTVQKSSVGANSVLGMSMAFAHAMAAEQNRPLFQVIQEMMGLKPEDLRLPIPLMNVLNGGLHANNGLEIQEFMIVPFGMERFSDALRAGCEVFQCLKQELHHRHLSTSVGDEGGFAPVLESNEAALDLLVLAIEKAGYQVGRQIAIALDVASSSFYSKENETYAIRALGKESLSSEELISYYGQWIKKYPIVSIEDGLDEDDWKHWSAMTESFGDKVQLVGDDLFVTQQKRVEKGIAERAANAVLIKVNQVGSLKETFETMTLCRQSGYGAVASHRSGETEDVTIAHLAVGSGCGQIKTGSLSRGERTAKYNELLRIERWALEHGIPIPFAKKF